MNRKYISVLTEYPKNVISSQVVEYLEFYDRQSVNFDVVFLLRLGEYIKGFKGLPGHKTEIEKKIKGKVSFYPTGRNPGSMFQNLVSTFIMFVFLLKQRKSEKIVLHCRGSASGYIAAKLKSYFKNLVFVYDVRADQAAEYIYYANKEGTSEKKQLKELNADKKMQIMISKKADKAFFVSDVLKERFILNYKLESKKTQVIPCLADPNKFYFDKIVRDKTREKLGIDKKFVFVYPGGIGYWHYSDTIFEIMGEMMNKNKNVFFIVLTPSVVAATKLAEKKLIKGHYYIKNAKRDEVSSFLMASDMGVLLRERDPLNEVAAPTKFAEYVMTGLPVLISEYVGDYSDFVAKNNLGLVLPNKAKIEEYCEKINKYIQSTDKLKRDAIAKIGVENFSKSKYANLMAEIYKTI